MKDKLNTLFEQLSDNTSSYICYYENNIRKIVYFNQLSRDIDACINRLNCLKSKEELKTLAIIGPTSYEWMVIDLACIKGGFKSVAIPETLSTEKIQDIIADTATDLILMDYSLKERCTNLSNEVYFFRCPLLNRGNNFNNIPEQPPKNTEENKILEEYGIAFSSGTSENVKKINLKLRKKENSYKKGLKGKLNQLLKYYEYKRSFWSKKNNKIIVFMPFSHPQQRTFILQSLLLKMNIVLSGPVNCLKHIIIEKPNVMISVPVFYEALAMRIKAKIDSFPPLKKQLFNFFNLFHINRFNNRNIIKRIFSKFLFEDIKKIYGGRSDYFVTGSASINPNALRVFYSIGVKIFEGYGQSETDIIAMNSHRHFRIGSVGKPLVDVKINKESEILIKYDEDKYGQNKDILNIDKDGYIHTGDLGYIDRGGFLFLTGRKDDVIVLSNGKKLYPGEIEKKFKKYEFINHALVLSLDMTKVNMISNCVNSFCKDKVSLQKKITNSIREVNKLLPDYERIESFYCAKEPFTVANGLLTPTFKMKRKSIIDRYSQNQFIRV